MRMFHFPQSMARDERGASAVEFALLAPVLLAFIMLLIESGRMQWSQQVIQEVASNTARCMALGTTDCANTADIQRYARRRSLAWGVSLANATITPTANQTCDSVAGMNLVTITLPYRTAAGALLPGAPDRLRASACFPSIA